MVIEPEEKEPDYGRRSKMDAFGSRNACVIDTTYWMQEWVRT